MHRTVRTSSLLAFLSLSPMGAVTGCDGDTPSESDGTGEAEGGASDSQATESGAGGSGSATEGGGSSTSGDSQDTSGGTSTEGGDGCSAEVRRYVLTGSKINIDSTIDFEVTVQEPYDQPLNTGPGHVVLRLAQDQTGQHAQLLEFSLMQDFVTGAAAFAEVTTKVLSTQPYAECGGPVGQFAGDTLQWSNDQLAPYCRDGQVSCTGSFCGMVGSPPEGEPFVFVNECSTAITLNSFVFNADRSGFTMEAAILSDTDGETTTLSLAGQLAESTPDAMAPACACGAG